jgi:hypothetical protein
LNLLELVVLQRLQLLDLLRHDLQG